jgi:anaerobic magnesium-protoporphyrin IX monomethyl ester cyclase
MQRILMFQFQNYAYLGVAYLSGAVKAAGHEFKLVLAQDKKVTDIVTVIEAFNPDFLGFTCMTGIHREALDLAKRLKETGVKAPTIFGGPHPTLFYEDMITKDVVDIICIGEGEQSLVNLLNTADQKSSYFNVPGFCFKDRGQSYIPEPLPELDNLSPCDWSCYEGTPALDQLPVIMPIRGCPYSCTYCFNEGMRELFDKNRYIRHHSPQRAVEEALSAVRVFRQKSPVIIQSDTIGIDLEWTREFFELFHKDVNSSFVALLRPELVKQELVDILKTHNCHSVAIGVESGSERVRNELLNRKYSNQLLIDVADRLHKAGIRFRSYNLMAIPTETESEIWETISINVRMKTDWPRPAIFIPMPRTKLTEIAIREKYLDRMEFDDLPANINVMSPTMLKKFDADRIQMLYYFFQTAVLFPRLHPLIRWLLAFKPNWLYALWFKIVYALLHRASEGRSLLHYIRYIWNNRKYVK